MTEPKMPEVGDIVADKYKVIKLIGEGGMGSVFMAEHTMTGKQVALKWMLPELAKNEDAVQRFLREAQAAGRIHHPNVVDIYDVGEHEESPFLVMEYLHGEPFTTALERGGMTASQIIDILLPCLRGVAAAHKKGVVHRDLKPDNIFLCFNDEGIFIQPKVLDFGISKLSGNDGNMNPRLTRTGAVMGTPYYMSPEQIRGSHDVDGRCDVYAFGVILYEALTGEVPFSAETYSALVLEIATGTPRRPVEVNPDIPPDLEAVVMTAMAREPEDRYEDVAAFGNALQPFAATARFTMERLDPTGSHRNLTGGNVTSTPFATEHTQPAPPTGRPMGLIVGGAVAAALLAGLAFAFMGTGESTDAAAGAPDVVHGPVEPSAPAEDPTPAPEPSTDSPALPTGAELPTGAAPPASDAPEAPVDIGGPQPAVEADSDEASADDDPAADTDDDDADRERAKKASERERAKRRARRRRAQSAPVAAPEPPKPSAPKPEPAPTTKKRRGRTGGLSVDDF